ncbi:MAG: DUF992 domain-containing protein [Mariprofundaceae bacterium]|nr:DUF992 domain-containing protein [Mariprofundaceae bacterium]
MNRTLHTLLFGLLAVMLPLQLSAAPAETSAGTKIGKLQCQTIAGSGVNLIIHSTAQVKCEFTSTAGETEHYKGETGVALGVDLTYKKESSFTFVVLAADFKKGAYKFSGKYFGAGADATVGLGLGAGVLIGGSKKSVSLQPLGISATKGVGVSGGLTYLYLEADKAMD